MQRETNWADYLAQLAMLGHRRESPEDRDERLVILYFSWLVAKTRAEAESVVAPAAVGDVGALLGWLGQRKLGAAALFTSERLRATVDRQLAEPLTQLHDGDEIGRSRGHRSSRRRRA